MSAASASYAAVMPLGSSGWTASWDSDAHPSLSITVDFVTSAIVITEKYAQFVDPTPVVITFTQTKVDAVPTIRLNDETLINSTGESWPGFVMTLEDGLRGLPGATTFNSTQIKFGQPGGLSIAPFTTLDYADSDQTLVFGGGSVSDAIPTNIWWPGHSSGSIFINAAPGNSPQTFKSFTLTEYPIPEPGALSLLALPALVMLRRRSS